MLLNQGNYLELRGAFWINGIAMVDHKYLFTVLRILPTDYTDYGGKFVRWEKDDEGYPDCSCGCKWAAWPGEPFGSGWCVCTKPRAAKRAADFRAHGGVRVL